MVEGEDGSVVHVYGSDGCPTGWCIHVSLFYKAAMPFHFMPLDPALFSHPVLRLSVVSVEEILKRMILFCKVAVEGRGPVDEFPHMDF
ncbi:unnamed protein product [Miscanthus lutarioriparius]|uniref:Uncharacterized protein n=1 Tax=Miscanthus lutarioriparius TaxID=422564 RepID=A0A811NP82_9POAL|nr:unnamed protein product [Miscanthus lutarioriparius]